LDYDRPKAVVTAPGKLNPAPIPQSAPAGDPGGDNSSSESENSQDKRDRKVNEAYDKKKKELDDLRSSMTDRGRAPYVNTNMLLYQNGPQLQLLKQEDKFPELKILKDLSVSSIIQFCHDYMSYRSGLGAPQPIQKCMGEKVRENLVSSPQGVD